MKILDWFRRKAESVTEINTEDLSTSAYQLHKIGEKYAVFDKRSEKYTDQAGWSWCSEDNVLKYCLLSKDDAIDVLVNSIEKEQEILKVKYPEVVWDGKKNSSI
jgi:hypothetical protein